MRAAAKVATVPAQEVRDCQRAATSATKRLVGACDEPAPASSTSVMRTRSGGARLDGKRLNGRKDKHAMVSAP